MLVLGKDLCVLVPGVCIRMMEGHKSLDPILVEKRHCVEDLCVRGSKQVDDGSYQFTRDVRLNLVSSCVRSKVNNVRHFLCSRLCTEYQTKLMPPSSRPSSAPHS